MDTVFTKPKKKKMTRPSQDPHFTFQAMSTSRPRPKIWVQLWWWWWSLCESKYLEYLELIANKRPTELSWSYGKLKLVRLPNIRAIGGWLFGVFLINFRTLGLVTDRPTNELNSSVTRCNAGVWYLGGKKERRYKRSNFPSKMKWER